MLNNSIVLGPTVVAAMVRVPPAGLRGGVGGCLSSSMSSSSFSLCRSVSNGMASPSPSSSSYFLSLMGLYNGPRGQEEPDIRRGEGSSSGTASNGNGSSAHHAGGPRSSSVSGAGNLPRPVPADRRGHGLDMQVASQRAGPPPGSVMAVVSSRAMVEDYVSYRLERIGVPWESGQRDRTPDATQRAMRGVGDELAARFSDNIDGMVSRLQLTPDNGQERLRTVMEEMFADGEVSWGRLAALLEFAAKLAARCVQQSRPQLVLSIVDWVSSYVDTRLGPWIAQNDGWAGFVKFHEDLDQHSKEWWSSLKTVFTLGAAAVGFLTLTALWKS